MKKRSCVECGLSWKGECRGYCPRDKVKWDGRVINVSECVWCDVYFFDERVYGRYGWCQGCTKMWYEEKKMLVDVESGGDKDALALRFA